MRSRYSAFVFRLRDYLLDTWHPSTRPANFDAERADTTWLGLEVKRFEQQDDDHATVEFVARSKRNGRAHRQHESSSFVREGGRWLYVSGIDPRDAAQPPEEPSAHPPTNTPPTTA